MKPTKSAFMPFKAKISRQPAIKDLSLFFKPFVKEDEKKEKEVIAKETIEDIINDVIKMMKPW